MSPALSASAPGQSSGHSARLARRRSPSGRGMARLRTARGTNAKPLKGGPPANFEPVISTTHPSARYWRTTGALIRSWQASTTTIMSSLWTETSRSTSLRAGRVRPVLDPWVTWMTARRPFAAARSTWSDSSAAMAADERGRPARSRTATSISSVPAKTGSIAVCGTTRAPVAVTSAKKRPAAL